MVKRTEIIPANNTSLPTCEKLLVYIASDVRSGSTLLDFILGSHPKITSVGEIQFLLDHFKREPERIGWICESGNPLTSLVFL